MIEQAVSAEKGLTQRFLWVFPEPSFAKLEDLEEVDPGFCDYLGEQWTLSLQAHITSNVLIPLLFV